MAEFTDLGDHCAWQDCNDLDFLPIVCQFCRKNFCKLHFLPDRHGCQEYVDKKTDKLERTDVRYKCGVESCTRWELAPVVCSACSLQVCLTHRHQDSHKCSNLAPNLERMPATKAHVSSILSSAPPRPAPEQRRRSKAAQRTAAKVQLMKLKMKSRGQESLPDTERIYFLVHPPKESKKAAVGCFVSSTWSIGKAIDTIADLTGTKNENNVAEARKLRLFRTDGEQLTGDISSKLQDLLSSETLYNGDTILLDYL